MLFIATLPAGLVETGLILKLVAHPAAKNPALNPGWILESSPLGK